MPPPADLALTLSSPAATTRLAQLMAPGLVPGDTILLGGPIGAGKTHFARAVIQQRLAEAGRIEDVPSPTFTLVQTYDDGRAEIWHADLYRLSSPEEISELGLDDAFRNAITLVEWPDRLGDARPPDALDLTLSQGDAPDMRDVVFRGPARRWGDRLARLNRDAAADA